MTQPEPTPGATATEPTPASAPPAEPSNQAFDGEFDPERAAKLIENLRKDLASEKSKRTSVEKNAEQSKRELAQQVAKALGLAGDEPPDPAQLTQHLESAQAAAWRSGVELAVFRSAGSLGGDPEKLLDSLAFIDSLDDLVNTDPSSQDFRTALEAKVREAVERNPAYRLTQTPTAPRPDPSQGPRTPGAPQRPKSLSDAVRTAVDAAKQTPGR